MQGLQPWTYLFRLLEALASHNPAVREEELEALRQERAALDGAIETTRLRLDSVRVIVTVDAHER